jgi:type VI secretion system protein ImpA
MASPPILDFDTLLAPIPGSAPAGEALPFTVRKKLDDARKEINPKMFAPDDPRRPEQFQPADWAGIETITQETLTQTSKDLSVAGRLTEALVKRHGFGGLRDGLQLMRRLVDECWDRIQPIIEDGNLEVRATAFNWLDDDFKGAKFPNTLRTVPLAKMDEERTYGWQQWKDSQEARGAVSAEAFDQAVLATPREYCQNVVDDLAASVAELEGLSNVLSTRLGESAPGLSQIRKAILECQDLAKQILHRKGPASLAAPEATGQENGVQPTESAAAGQPASVPAARRPLTREDVLARLSDASALLLQMEPHSPIAYMIQRAVRLAQLPFPDLMKVLIRDPGVLTQLDRDLDLGLEKQEAAKQEAAKAAKGR